MAPIRTPCDDARHPSRPNFPPPPPHHPYRLLRRREPPTPRPHHSLLSGDIPGAGRCARSLGGGIHRAAPLPRVPHPAPLRCDGATGRNLLVATLGDRRTPCSARRPCSKPCSPGWAEIEQEWILWCTRMRVPTNLTLSRPALLSPSALCIGSFVGLATPVKFDIGGKQKSRGRLSLYILPPSQNSCTLQEFWDGGSIYKAS